MRAERRSSLTSASRWTETSTTPAMGGAESSAFRTTRAANLRTCGRCQGYNTIGVSTFVTAVTAERRIEDHQNSALICASVLELGSQCVHELAWAE